ncbi:MAG: hypothetical protein ACOYWZ_04775 [Bacillota bacterium]
MEYLKHRLLRESVRFIEMCQIYVLKGKINVETYNSLSDIKLDFIKDMLESEKTRIYFDRRFSNRINNLFKTNSLINLNSDVVGR